MLSTDLLTFNGLDGATGDYLQRPLTLQELTRGLRSRGRLSEYRDKARLWLAEGWKVLSSKSGFLESTEEPDLQNPASCGWGIVFAEGENREVREALSELTNLRRAQVGERLYQELEYKAGETASQFQSRYEVGHQLNPRKIPYYLLLVGDPETIPFHFQQVLDVRYAVGRLDLDSVEDYRAYARSVVATETEIAVAPPAQTLFVSGPPGGAPSAEHRATFFAVRNCGDLATAVSADHLVGPLEQAVSKVPGWKIDMLVEDDATKDNLAAVFGGSEPPALLFGASHGVGFDDGHPRQLGEQGAIVCQDWPGPRREILPAHLFGADDLAPGTSLQGLVFFYFGCYGAGTPKERSKDPILGKKKTLAPTSFVARLPRRLLALPDGGGMAAMIAHVDRSWGYSYLWPGMDGDVGLYSTCLKRLMRGAPVGWAMDPFDRLHGERATEMTEELERVVLGDREPENKEWVRAWLALIDARNYIVLGDPAIRLRGFGSPPPRRQGPLFMSGDPLPGRRPMQ